MTVLNQNVPVVNASTMDALLVITYHSIWRLFTGTNTRNKPSISQRIHTFDIQTHLEVMAVDDKACDVNIQPSAAPIGLDNDYKL